ncbi:hypothetical protein MHK_004984 [Candidatus Magnetomorum sp. HK-1]|nr:hypothetical protein MHK_004984 [Candidatus Magnetomorum sp. HK-1]
MINGFDHTNLKHIENKKKECKRYDIHWKKITPQGVLHNHFKKFIDISKQLPNKIGNKLIEIGVGFGGFSYTAQKSGFDVTCTTLGEMSDVEKKSWELLNLNPVYFKMGQNSFSELLKDGIKPNIIYSCGVPFNRDFSVKNNIDPFDDYWFDEISYWFPIIDDVFVNLSDGGFFFSNHNYHLNQSLTNDLIVKMKTKYGPKCDLLFNCYAMTLENKKVPVTNMFIVKK